MNNFVSLKVKCPHCETSFMDKEMLIDNVPSIKMNIAFNDKKGLIRLSSIYGSYNYSSNIEIPSDTVVEFSCPHCGKKVMSDVLCSSCEAPMVPLHLIEGGEVHFCARAGCKNHSVEFEKLSAAIRHFYKDHDFGNKVNQKYVEELQKQHNVIIKEQAEQDKEIMKTGTYLQSFCPSCKKTLLQDNMLKFKVIKEDGEEGYLMLSPYLNVFLHKSTIHLPEDKTVKDIGCPHCGTSLMEEEKNCGKCGSSIAKINVAALSKLINFYICSKKGCTWHGLSDEDLNDIILEDSEEW